MYKLIVYELRKIFSKRILYIVLPVFIFLSNASIIVPAIMSGNIYSNRNFDFEDFYNEYGGDLTEDKYKFLMEEYEASETYYEECGGEEKNEKGKFANTRLQDYFLLSSVKYDIDYIKKYEEDQNKLIVQAEENITLYTERQDTYKVRENRQIRKLYDIKPKIKLINTGGWYSFENNKEILFILLCIVMFVCGIFSDEQEQNMFPILYTGARGRKALAAAKVLAASIFAFAVSIVFEIVKYIICYFNSGLTGFGEFIQSYSVYEYCPFNITMLEFIVINTVLIGLGAVCFSIMVCLISALCNKNITSLIIGIFLIIVIYGNIYRAVYLPTITGSGGAEVLTENFIDYLNMSEKYFISGMFQPQRFFMGYHVVKLFDYPILTVIFNVVFTGIKILLISGLAIMAYTKKKFYMNRISIKNIFAFKKRSKNGEKYDGKV